MKRLLIIIAILMIPVGTLAVGPSTCADEAMTFGDWKAQSVRQFYATGSGAISESVTIPHQGTQLFELVSIELHLSAAGTAGTLTVIKNSGLGAEYDALWFSQDMTSVTDLVILYGPGEVLFSKLDSLDFAWANASLRTYGLTVKYLLR